MDATTVYFVLQAIYVLVLVSLIIRGILNSLQSTEVSNK